MSYGTLLVDLEFGHILQQPGFDKCGSLDLIFQHSRVKLLLILVDFGKSLWQ